MVPNYKPTKCRLSFKWLNYYRLYWYHLNQGRLCHLNGRWILFDDFSCRFVYLCDELIEFAWSVSGVTVDHWGVSSLDFTWVVKNDDLG